MFKTFPDFSKLTLSDKDAYETLIKDYPPMSSFSFVDLMTWWNALGYGSVSLLNGNLVIPYWIPGDDKTSSLSLIGTHSIDESICTIFDHLREKGEKPRLVNVPEFVISSIQYPEMFHFKSHRDCDEYLVPVDDHYPVERMKSIWRHKVQRKLPILAGHNVEAKELDLRLEKNKNFLINALYSWQAKNINNYGKLEIESVILGVRHAWELDLKNVCLFVDGELYGFCTYAQYGTTEVGVHCLKATHSKTLGYELIAYLLAKWFKEHGIKTVNLNSDYGMLRIRMFALTFGPMNFYRKYTVEPA